jgi:hypothetical protein
MALRAAFLAHQPRLDPARTFFIDETGSTTAMARDYGRAPRGERIHDDVPRNYGDVITIVGALTTGGLSALFSYRGGTTKEVFYTYVREVLLRELRPGDAVVLDNLAVHKDALARSDRGCRGQALLPAALQPGPQPDRAGLVLDQALAQDRTRTHGGCGQQRARNGDGHDRSGNCSALDRALRIS